MMVRPSWTSDEEQTLINECFGHSSILSNSTAQELQQIYKTSSPYLHLKLENFLNPDLLSNVRNEILQHLHFTEKETDIYKIRQTGDLANLDGLDQNELTQLSNLLKLRNALYSFTFRNWVSQVTQCGALSGLKQDLSINSYTAGCHLLNHDDVIGTRKVSYILYLPDPEIEWTAEDGGALELYPCKAPGIPLGCPTQIYVPKFNQFIFFTVQPGYSFHAVQEVFNLSKNRLSISGWFHVPQPGEPGYQPLPDGELASLAQLEGNTTMFDTPYLPLPLVLDPETIFVPLSKEELDCLSSFVNPVYLTSEHLLKINDRFSEDSLVQLTDFFQPALMNKIATFILNQDQLLDLNAYEPPLGWDLLGSPVKQRYLIPKDVARISPILKDVYSLFTSSAFLHWLGLVTGFDTLSSWQGHLRRFRPGLDYTLATAALTDILEVFLDLTPPPWPVSSNASTFDLGGYVCYLGQSTPQESSSILPKAPPTPSITSTTSASSSPSEMNDDPAVYRTDAKDNDVLATLTPSFNVLTLIVREKQVKQFVKYLSRQACRCRWDMAFEYPIELGSEDFTEA